MSIHFGEQCVFFIDKGVSLGLHRSYYVVNLGDFGF
jgi:hypothetical protein